MSHERKNFAEAETLGTVGVGSLQCDQIGSRRTEQRLSPAVPTTLLKVQIKRKQSCQLPTTIRRPGCHINAVRPAMHSERNRRLTSLSASSAISAWKTVGVRLVCCQTSMTLGDSVQHCDPDQIRGPLHAELGFYLGAVIDDSLVADAHCFGNLRQGAAIAQEPQDFQIAAR